MTVFSPCDYVILRKSNLVQISPENRDIAAVVFRDEDDKATLKRILIERDGTNRPVRVILSPESSNPEHKVRSLPPTAFVGDNRTVTIAGIAIAVLQPFTEDELARQLFYENKH